MASHTANGVTWSYTYDADGLRTGRTDGTNTYQYIYAGDKLVRMIYNGEVVDISYAGSQPLSLTYDGATYYYVLNGQGDVIGLTNSSGKMVIGYTFGAYGVATGLVADPELSYALVQMNPLTYRGYVYDRETKFFYLQSRYYDPELGRFINADAYASTGQGVLGNNMFSYCYNNPIMFRDQSGAIPRTVRFAVCIRFEDNHYEEKLADYIDTIAKPLDIDFNKAFSHTVSVGVTGGASNGGVSLGQSYCVSGDSSGNFALQQTTSQGASAGMGGSAGVFVSVTNAHDVQDLAGESYSVGMSIFYIEGLSIEIVRFEPTPGDVRWGVTLVYGAGAEASLYENESYTTSTKSWHIWDLFTK